MTEQPRMRCGSDPRARLTPGDQAAVDQFREYLAARKELGPEVHDHLFQALRRTELTTAQMSHLVVVFLPVVRAAAATAGPREQGAFPTVQGRCPACGGESLFLGSGGYVTCSRIDCPEPDAASTILERPAREEGEPQPAPQCTATLDDRSPAYRCVRDGQHDSHVTSAGARWGTGSPARELAEKDTRAPAGAPTGESTPLLSRGGEDL